MMPHAPFPPTPKGFLDPFRLAGLPEGSNAPVAVALSGGADSVALLHMLTARGTDTVALHVNHGIRGAEAERDAAFCRSLCASLGVPFTLLSVDVPALLQRDTRGVGVETVAREARYAALTAHMKKEGLSLLLTAHHADDQLETLLQNLLRGSGLRGLCGIPACRELEENILVARPLLQISKKELLAYCEAAGLSFVTDSTNEEPICPRNRLRAEVLPVLESLWQGGAVAAARCAATLAEDEEFLSSLAEDFLRREGNTPTVTALASLPRVVLVRVVQRLLPTPPERVHIKALEQLVTTARPHSSLSLPDVTVSLENGRLTLSPAKTASPAAALDYTLPLQMGEMPLPHGIGTAILSVDDVCPAPDIPFRYTATVALPRAVLSSGEAHLRPRREGDRILSGGMHKSVRKLSALSHLPPKTRARMPLLCDGEGLLAVPLGPTRDGMCARELFLHVFFN